MLRSPITAFSAAAEPRSAATERRGVAGRGAAAGVRGERMRIIRVTFDSNTLDRAVRPDRFPKDPQQGAYIKVRSALAAGRLKGYFGESLITLEGIENKDRVGVMSSTRLAMQELRPYTASDRREVIEVPMRMEQARKDLHLEQRARILAALKLKVHALRGPNRNWLDSCRRSRWYRIRDS